MDTLIIGSIIKHLSAMAAVAQLVRALACDAGCREFESRQPPHTKRHVIVSFFYYSKITMTHDVVPEKNQP